MKRFLLALLLVCAAGAAHADVTLNRGNGGEPETLDPQQAGTRGEDHIIGDMLVGLTTADAAGKPIPGMALNWDTTADGLTWTFHLRDALWSDGAKVTANDFVFSFRRLLDPKTGARYAYNLWVLRNAKKISQGALPASALGVAAPDARTLVLTLEHPAPYLPQLLMHLTALPVPRQSAEKNPRWAKPGSYIANGPYLLKEWLPNDHITLVKNPRFYDAAHVKIDRVVYYPTGDASAALKRLRAGELDMLSSLPLTQLDWLRANMPRALHITPILSVAYVSINFSTPPLRDVRVRKALNLAYNREVVTEKIIREGEPPAYNYVPPATANYPGGAAMDFKAMAYPARIALAQTLMRDAGYGPGHPLRLVYSTTTSPDSRRLAAIFQAMVKPVYIDLQVSATDLQIHFRNLRLHQFQLGGESWIADFNDASNFLDLLRSDSGNNYGGYKNPKFDAAMDAAQQEPDLARRGQKLLTAEKIALADYPWLVTRFISLDEVAQPYIKGFADNALGLHRSRWLWLQK